MKLRVFGEDLPLPGDVQRCRAWYGSTALRCTCADGHLGDHVAVVKGQRLKAWSAKDATYEDRH